jgi:CubicO group peptidase (beta-lactamase class C family)
MLLLQLKRVSLISLFVATAVALSSCASHQSKENTAKQAPPYSKPGNEEFSPYADELIEKAMSKNEIVGLSAIVFDANKILWQKDYGFSNKDQKILINGNTQYQIGSLTKLISAAAIMTLQEKNLLSINDPVSQYLPGFPVGNCYGGKAITIKDLLIHESGLANSYWPSFWTQTDWRNIYQQLDCSMVPFSPNTIQSYSNIAFTLLGNIIERVSGKTYENYIRDTVFAPLHMQNSDFESFDNRNAALQNLSKSFDEKNKTVGPSFVRDTPAGGVVASVSDFVKFAQVFLPGSTQSGILLDSKSINTMLTPQGSANNMAMDAQMGLGWFLKTSPLNGNAYVIEHSGSTIYHHSQIIMYPEHNIGIIIMANSGVRFSLGDIAGALFNRATGIPDAKWAEGPDNLPAKSSPAFCEAGEIPGYYQSESGLVDVSATKKGLDADVGKITLNLKDAGNHYYDPSIKLLGVLPLGKLIFGDLQVSLRCQNTNTFAVIRDANKHFTVAYKVHATNQNDIDVSWLGEYHATQSEERTHKPIIKIWKENGFFFAETRQFPVNYQPVKFLVNRSDETSVQLLYLGDHWGPKMVFTESSGQVSLNFMGYHFIKQ